MSSYAMRDLGGGTAGGLLAARANQAPDKAALVFGGSETTYRQLDDAASAVASALIGLGLQPGDAVSVFMSNRPECLVASFAIGRAGLRLVPVNTAYKGAFLDFAIDHSESRAIITESLLGGPLAELERLPKSVAAIVYVDGRPDRLPAGDVAIHDWEELLAPSVLLTEFPPVGPDYISSIGYTSGTTGRSKGVLSPALQGVMHAAESAVAMGTTSQDRLYTCLPLFHGAAFSGTCLHARHCAGPLTAMSSGPRHGPGCNARPDRAGWSSAGLDGCRSRCTRKCGNGTDVCQVPTLIGKTTWTATRRTSSLDGADRVPPATWCGASTSPTTRCRPRSSPGVPLAPESETGNTRLDMSDFGGSR